MSQWPAVSLRVQRVYWLANGTGVESVDGREVDSETGRDGYKTVIFIIIKNIYY